MQIKKIGALILVLLLAASALSAPVPRQSPEFTINEPSGKTELLSSFKGKVVMIEFLFLRSQKCLHLASTMNKLNAELGSRGFQPVAIAFPVPQSDANGPLVGAMADSFNLTYPVGYAQKQDVDQYLSREPKEMLRIPQVIIIDRDGTIRFQTGGHDGNVQLEDEAYLRTTIEGLLKEPAPGPAHKN